MLFGTLLNNITAKLTLLKTVQNYYFVTFATLQCWKRLDHRTIKLAGIAAVLLEHFNMVLEGKLGSSQCFQKM